MVCNIRFNTAKKHKLKDQAARQKHYVQTLSELELHIICLKVAVQCSKMCYLLESYQRLLESALHPPAVLCFCHWFFQNLTHNEKWGERIFDFFYQVGKCNSLIAFEICKLFYSLNLNTVSINSDFWRGLGWTGGNLYIVWMHIIKVVKILHNCASFQTFKIVNKN